MQEQFWNEEGAYQRDWTDAGREYWALSVHEDEDGELLAKAVIERAIDELEWVDATVDLTLPALSGMAITEVVRELRIPKVTQISYGCNELAPYGFYGIEGNYKNGRVRVYVVDSGTECTPVCMDHWTKEGVAKAS